MVCVRALALARSWVQVPRVRCCWSSWWHLLTLAGLASAASASTTDELRGEWELTFTCPECEFVIGEPHMLHGVSLIDTMEASSGDFSGSVVLENERGLPATITGSLSGSQVSSLVVEVMLPTGPPYDFTMTSGSVNGAENEISGSGTFTATGSGGPPAGTFTAKKLRSYKEVEEEEKRIKKEAEERAKKEAEERAKAREERKIKEAEEAKVEEAKKAEEAIKAKEREVQEQAEQAKAQKEREAQEAKAAQEAKVAQEAKAAQEAKEAQAAKEAREREEREKSNKPAGLTGKTFTVGTSGLVSLGLSNPDDYSILGKVTLTEASAGKASRGKPKATILASASYTIVPLGSGAVKLKLSKGTLAALRSHKVLHVVVTITTSASGHATITETDDLTLEGPSAHGHR